MITVVVLSHDNESIIARCLAALTLWAGQIILIDDASHDETVRIAKKYTPDIYQHHLADDFAGQRNFGLTKAKGEWVLFIDSDEVVSPDLAKEIQDAVKEAKDDVAGYWIRRLDWMWGRELRHGETGDIRLIRLARKDAGSWRGPVHETWQIKGNVGLLEHPLTHYPHPNVAQFLDKINYYSTLRSQELYENKVRVSWWQIIAYPKAKFFVNYVWRLGFLDGTAGAVHAILMSFHSFLVRSKLYTLYHRHHE